MNLAAAILACGSMHLPWWVGPVVLYLLIGWALSAVFALINLAQIIHGDKSSDFKIVNTAVWSLYAVPILVVALVLCHVVSPQVLPVPGWLGGGLGIYSLLVPLMTGYHTVFLIRNGRSTRLPDQPVDSAPSV